VFNRVTDIFKINCESDFEELALEVFRFQYRHNSVYQKWVNELNIKPEEIKDVDSIPFLPIEFFKSLPVIAYPENEKEEAVFLSSSTTSQVPSRHYVRYLEIYKQSFTLGFSRFFGDIQQYCFIALLPGYLEREGSSLVYMCHHLIEQSRHPLSGFYLRNLDELIEVIETLKQQNQKTIIIGVSYALLDLAEKGITLTDQFTVMETGGMKGTRKEMLKEELHTVLKNAFNMQAIAGEYGMTELLSQAYAMRDGKYIMPAWMQVRIRDVNDPFTQMKAFKTGGINVIDLANVYSCSFIATKDLGFMDENGFLNLRGRYDNSDIRGCNLMVT
jgi:phenylacetate-coenzyme A ligase PaaK-like adenylate-forming protein